MTHLLLTQPAEGDLSDFWLSNEEGEKNKCAYSRKRSFVALRLVAELTD
jgi:hypothetical protein